MAATRPKPKRRKLELYELTISGMHEDVDYQKFLRSLWSNLETRENRIFTPGGKGHALDRLQITKGNLWFQLFSFAAGERPEVLDTDDMSISENPLTASEALLIGRTRWEVSLKAVTSSCFSACSQVFGLPRSSTTCSG